MPLQRKWYRTQGRLDRVISGIVGVEGTQMVTRD